MVRSTGECRQPYPKVWARPAQLARDAVTKRGSGDLEQADHAVGPLHYEASAVESIFASPASYIATEGRRPQDLLVRNQLSARPMMDDGCRGSRAGEGALAV